MKLLELVMAGGLMWAGVVPPAVAQQVGPLPVVPDTDSPQTQQGTNSAAVKSAATSAKPGSASDRGKAGLTIPLPAGTRLPLVLENAVSTRSTKPGDPVYFETTYPIILNGKILVPAGSWVNGVVTESKKAGRIHGRAELMMRLTTLILPNAYVVSLVASPSDAGTGGKETTDREGRIKGDSDKAGDAGTVITSTMAGAGIGAMAAQSARGAGIGAGIGAAAGLAAVLLSRGPNAELPRGTTLDAVLDHTIMLDAAKVDFKSPGQATALPGPAPRDRSHSARIPFPYL